MRWIRVPRSPRGWLFVGLLVREAFSFWTGHPFDMEIWIRNSFYVSAGWNPYQLMPPVPGLSFAYTSQSLPSIGYLPLWPIMLASLYRIFTILQPGNRFVLYILLKQPAILGDLAVGYLLYVAILRWRGDANLAKQGLRFWVTFPYAIFISAIWGQFDALTISFVLASLVFLSGWRRAGSLGIAILLKSIPVIFVPYSFLRLKGVRRVETLLAVVVPVVLTTAIFAATGWSFGGLGGTLTWQAHGDVQGLSYGEILGDPRLAPLLPPYPVLIVSLGYLWIPAVIIVSILARSRFASASPHDALQGLILVVGAFFLVHMEVNEQYLLYLLPLQLLDALAWHPERRPLFRATWSIALVFLVVNNFLLVRFIAPIYPDATAFENFWASVPLLDSARHLLLDAIAIVFSIHMVQLFLVTLRPGRDPRPWIFKAIRSMWEHRPTLVIASNRGGE